MTLTIFPSTTSSMTLEQYIEYVERCVDVTDEDAVLASAEQLGALANDRAFLVKKFNRELRDLATFQAGNTYSSQTLALGQGKGFYIRANMWVPPSDSPGGNDWESDLFAYARPHDHNFSFLTIGYFGSGYRTAIYEYDHDRIVGYPGEPVDLRFLEETSLHRGKVMFYRASRDVHRQEHPLDFSISINLMIVSPEVMANSQYWFDLENRTIRDYVQQNPSAGRVMLCHLAPYLGDDQTASVLETIAATANFPRVRLAAYEALAKIESPHGAGPAVWARAVDDRHPLVQRIAREALDAATLTAPCSAESATRGRTARRATR
jgi:hypothetical protein